MLANPGHRHRIRCGAAIFGVRAQPILSHSAHFENPLGHRGAEDVAEEIDRLASALRGQGYDPQVRAGTARTCHSSRAASLRGSTYHRAVAGQHASYWRAITPRSPYARPGPSTRYRGCRYDALSCLSLCENALRHALGETPEAHRDRIAELYSAMSRIAPANPNALIQREFSSDAIRNPSAANRMVAYPYTKLMTSNISVDQGVPLGLRLSSTGAEALVHWGEALVHRG